MPCLQPAAKETGIIRLDPDGHVKFETEELQAAMAKEQPEQPPPPPEPQVDLETIQKEAFQQGYQAGKQETLQAIQQELEQVRNNVQAIVHSIPARIDEAIAQTEPQLLALTLALAKKIIHAETRQNPEVISNVLQAALEKVKNQTVIAIRMHPEDIELVSPQFDDGRVELIPDKSVERGGCIVETDLGELDATIETQWAAVEQEMKKQAETE